MTDPVKPPPTISTADMAWVIEKKTGRTHELQWLQGRSVVAVDKCLPGTFATESDAIDALNLHRQIATKQVPRIINVLLRHIVVEADFVLQDRFRAWIKTLPLKGTLKNQDFVRVLRGRKLDSSHDVHFSIENAYFDPRFLTGVRDMVRFKLVISRGRIDYDPLRKPGTKGQQPARCPRFATGFVMGSYDLHDGALGLGSFRAGKFTS